MSAGPIVGQLLLQQTADETTSVAVDLLPYTQVTFYVIGTGTISGGVITFEEAFYDPMIFDGTGGFAGTWSSIGTMNAADVTAGAQKASHLTAGAYRWVRARISTAIAGGGNVTVYLVANSN